MQGVLFNTLTVIIGSTIGWLLKKGLPKRVTDTIMIGLGMCTVYIGVSGMLGGKNPLVLILSIAFGAAIGSLLKIDDGIHKLGDNIEKKFRRGGKSDVSLAEGAVNGCLIFCVGAMTIVGSLNAGFGDNTMLYTKSILDLVSSMVLASTLGIGVLLSSVFVLVFQGGLALLAEYISPIMTANLIAELTCVGSLMVALIGLNLMKITKIKVADFLPALLFVPLFVYLTGLLNKVM
ncbi:MAG: DUF554 domain-containing protein [Clostridia bacterium]|nr:DUF554 domain-containing protein [Clostridia bacterium]